MKVEIISGFLGAGKTRLIKKFIEEGLEEGLSEENIVVIENEFGEVGIDGDFLKEYDVQVKEIVSGCICCSAATIDFKNVLKEAIDSKNVRRIIIEPSGVAKLSEIVRLVEELEPDHNISLNMVITVVDATMVEDYIELFSEFYKDQIQSAKTIILSRTQDLDAQKLEHVVNRIKEFNEEADIITTPWDIISAKSIINVGENAIDSTENHEEHHDHDHDHDEVSHEHSHEEVFDSLAIETSKIYTEKELEQIFEKVKNQDEYGKILRLKGIIRTDESRWIAFDFEPNQFEIRTSKPKDIGHICFIGSPINKDSLNSLF